MSPVLKGVVSAVLLMMCPLVTWLLLKGVVFVDPIQNVIVFVLVMVSLFRGLDYIMVRLNKRRGGWE